MLTQRGGASVPYFVLDHMFSTSKDLLERLTPSHQHEHQYLAMNLSKLLAASLSRVDST